MSEAIDGKATKKTLEKQQKSDKQSNNEVKLGTRVGNLTYVGMGPDDDSKLATTAKIDT